MTAWHFWRLAACTDWTRYNEHSGKNFAEPSRSSTLAFLRVRLLFPLESKWCQIRGPPLCPFKSHLQGHPFPRFLRAYIRRCLTEAFNAGDNRVHTISPNNCCTRCRNQNSAFNLSRCTSYTRSKPQIYRSIWSKAATTAVFCFLFEEVHVQRAQESQAYPPSTRDTQFQSKLEGCCDTPVRRIIPRIAGRPISYNCNRGFGPMLTKNVFLFQVSGEAPWANAVAVINWSRTF